MGAPNPLSLLFLIGYRGTGKTTVARLVAAELDLDWVDADDRAETLADRSITDLFAQQGEAAFRDLEERVVEELCGRRDLVVALGGGAVLREANRGRIAAAGPAVWLRASPAILAGRLTRDVTTSGRRPQLTSAGALEEIEQVLAERTPIYRACATFEVDTDDRTPEDVAAEIVAHVTGRSDSK